MGSDAKHRPVYVISVAAELVDMHPQTLRLYERKGLIRPGRSSGKTRLYSERDIEHLREIRRLTQELGVNLAGVEEVMRLQHQLDDLQQEFEAEIERIEDELREQARPRALPAPDAPPDPRDRPVQDVITPAMLRAVFDVEAQVLPDPDTGRPLIVPRGGDHSWRAAAEPVPARPAIAVPAVAIGPAVTAAPTMGAAIGPRLTSAAMIAPEMAVAAASILCSSFAIE